LKQVGSYKGNLLTKALKEHIRLAAVTVLSAGTSRFEENVHAFLKQGDKVAYCVTDLHPSKLPIRVTKHEFKKHNKHVLKIATILLKQQFSKETKAYDHYYEHMLHLSDTIAKALT